MIHLLFLVYLAQVVQGTTTNSTSSSSSCLEPAGDGTTRSLWSILGSCAVTLLICVWHAVHFNVPSLEARWHTTWRMKGTYVISTFLGPEVMLATATEEWWKARRDVKKFREKGYEWSMTHSFFAGMDGFVYRDDDGHLRKIDSLEFLELCEANKIANPDITVEDIKDRSKSDMLGKAIFAIQLLWFILQVVIRVWKGLAVTLVELDTVCMAVLTLLLLFIWKNKPLRPERPHIFYSPQEVKPSPETNMALSQAWKSGHSCLYDLMSRFVCKRRTGRITDEEKMHPDKVQRFLEIKVDGFSFYHIPAFLALCIAWSLFGGLHLTAWNFPFATEGERMTWRIASLILAGSSLPLMVLIGLTSSLKNVGWCNEKTCGILARTFVILGLAFAAYSRMILFVLMFLSLRSVPCSAHHTVAWTAYIPHL